MLASINPGTAVQGVHALAKWVETRGARRGPPDSGVQAAREREEATSVLVRSLTYAALFIGIVLVFLPARVLAWAGVSAPHPTGVAGVVGLVAGALGAFVAVWCVVTFAVVGKGTPAPFDPPRRLVARGPYRVVRNPMYVGAGLALAGASLVYRSLALLGFTAAFLVVCHVFVLIYEEPTLRRMFGSDYEEYCRQVGRWWPRRRTAAQARAA